MTGRDTSSTRRCSVAIVSYNSAAHLPECLESLLAQERVACDVWVADNASADGTAALVRARFPGVHVIENGTNLGFAAGVNQVLEKTVSDAQWIALVNPDTIASPGAIAACLDVLEQEPDVAIVSPRLVYPDGRFHPSCHAFLGFWNLLGETLLLDRVFPRSPLGTFHMRDFAHDARRDVDWIQGAFLVVRAEAVRAIGPLDASFFMYGEEIDWCARMRAAGWRIVFLPEPPVVHVGGASSRSRPGPMFVELLKSRVRFLRKHRSAATVAAGRALIALAVAGRWLGWTLASALAPFAPAAFRERARVRRTMFGAAFRWVLAGEPLGPPELEGTTR